MTNCMNSQLVLLVTVNVRVNPANTCDFKTDKPCLCSSASNRKKHSFIYKVEQKLLRLKTAQER